MALQKMEKKGYGQLELNNVAFRRDGRIEAQCALDAVDFENIPAENGMLLAVDNVKRVIKMPKDAKLPIALNYTAEHMYDERTPGLRNFKLERGSFLPRLGYLAEGDKFTTNCLCYDDSEFENMDAFVAGLEKIGAEGAEEVYGTQSEIGYIKVSAEEPIEGVKLRAIKKTTMPDGQLAVKFQVLK